MPPSEKQLAVLRYIIAHVERHGFQPNQSEMAVHFGVTQNAISDRLKRLARSGVIDMPEDEKRRERAIRLKHVKFKALLKEKSCSH